MINSCGVKDNERSSAPKLMRTGQQRTQQNPGKVGIKCPPKI